METLGAIHWSVMIDMPEERQRATSPDQQQIDCGHFEELEHPLLPGQGKCLGRARR